MDSSLRQTVLTAARHFKAGWAELGRLLVQVRGSGAYSDWGYPTFEAYCSQELHLRRTTAQKLVRSFSFLARHEPELARPKASAPLEAPAFEVIEVLADADSRGQLSESEYRRIRDSIWNPERPASELKRELAERFPRPEPRTPSEATQLRRLAFTARKLAQDLKGSRRVPRVVVDHAEALADQVEALAAKASGAEAKAQGAQA